MIRNIMVPFLCLALFACSSDNSSQDEMAVEDQASTQQQRPNILLITMDDLGYTDLGFMGSEISTPNIDALAQSGVALTNFHAAPTCSPTRAMLMSGTDNHLAGLGIMAEAQPIYPHLRNKAGYEGYLNNSVVALPQLLKDAGYRTYVTGKWHLGMSDETSPLAKGFEQSFVLLDGGAGHFDDSGLMPFKPKASFRENGKLVDIPEDFYSSKFYAEKMISFLETDKENGAPFFAFLSFTAPHWPIQAPQESIKKYQGVYDQGYEALFEQRLNKQKSLNIIDQNVVGQALRKGENPWDQLTDEEKKVSAKKMEIYAAMVDDADKYLGDVIASLKRIGKYENTVIFFMSDNGAQAGTGGFPGLAKYIEACCDNSYENMGNIGSYLFTGPNWARASTGPGRLYKGYTTQGGIVAPAIISYPKAHNKGAYASQFVSVLDILPTFLELAETQHPGQLYKGKPVYPIKGESFTVLLDDNKAPIHDDSYAMGWELFGQKALRQGDWKIVLTRPPEGSDKWALYNVKNDPTELSDLLSQEPEVFKALLASWEDYKKDNGVIDLNAAVGF